MISHHKPIPPVRRADGGKPGYEPDEEEEEEPPPDDEEETGDKAATEEDTGDEAPEEADNRRIVVEAAKALRGESKDPQEAIQEFLEVFGRQKLEQLRADVLGEEEDQPAEKYAVGGRFIQGPGRGMDDRVSAAAGNQKVLLSDGEFVVPADVVSHLGDGSSAAGVRALEGMMARARMAKTGRRKQGGKINLKKVLPY